MLPELRARLSLPTPAFLKKVQRRTAAAAASFGALTVTLAGVASTVPSFPAFLSTTAGVASAFFGGIAAACSLAVDDATQLPAATDALTASPTPDAAR